MTYNEGIEPATDALTTLPIPPNLPDFLFGNNNMERRIRIVASSGAGKTVLESMIAFLDWACFGLPTIVLDPNGTLVDLLMSYIILQGKPETIGGLCSRVKYVDVGSPDYICPTPLYYRLGNESLYEVAGRYVETIRRLRPQLENAQVQGMPRIEQLGYKIGMAIAAMHCQITEAESIIYHPHRWKDRILRAEKEYPELAPVRQFLFEQFPKPHTREFTDLTNNFLTLIMPFSHDPVMTARYGASTPGFTWEEVAANRMLLLLDTRNLKPSNRRFALVWLFYSLMEYIGNRPNYPPVPLSLVIDEMAYFMSQRTGTEDLLADDYNMLINDYSRKKSIWPTLSQQEIYQAERSPTMAKHLLTLPIQIFGRMSDYEAAMQIAQGFREYEPHKIKDTKPQYAYTYESPYWFSDRNKELKVDLLGYESIYFSPEEQDRQNAREFMRLKQFEFFRALHGTNPEPFTITPDPASYGDPREIAKAREYLLKRDSRPRQDILKEIAARQSHALPAPPTQRDADDDEPIARAVKRG